VGYGDFTVNNAYEILVTNFWMFIGVIFYSFVVGVMTSFATTRLGTNELLKA